MRTFLFNLTVFTLFLSNLHSAIALPNLYDWAFNIDGDIYEQYNGDMMPVSGSLDSNGTGILSWTTSEVGSHNFLAFFDYEMTENINMHINEYGTVTSIPSSFQQWEIDEPGYVHGDIYENVLAGSLDNTNSIPQGSEDDVSWAMGWNFLLNEGETATILLNLSTVISDEAFYLSQIDPDSDEILYFSSNLNIQGSVLPVPEPATIFMLVNGIGFLGLIRKCN